MVATTLWRRQHPEWSLDHPGAPRFELTWSQTPRYLKHRLDEKVARRRREEDVPWLPDDAIRALERLLRPTDAGLEFGAGSSTAWLARHTGSLTSIEPSSEWVAIVRGQLSEAGVDNVDLRHLPGEDGSPEHRDAVLAIVDEFGPDGLDYVFVDGLYRDDEALRATTVVRSGGLVIVDNVNTYLPGPGHSPWRVHAPATATWAKFAATVADWRHLWTSNGVWDTAIWIRP